MEKNLSTFNFETEQAGGNALLPDSRRLPKAFLITLVLIFFLEAAFFSKAWLLGNWNNIVIHHKKSLLKDKNSADIVFFGDSLLIALDAKKLEESLSGQNLSVYNYYIANLGPSFYLSLIVRQYLKHKKPPKIILLSVAPQYFYQDGGLVFPRKRQEGHFRRFIGLEVFLSNLPFKTFEKWSRANLKQDAALFVRSLAMLKEYLWNGLPSFDYRAILIGAGPSFLRLDELPDDDMSKGHPSLRSSLRDFLNNLEFIDYLKDRNGKYKNDTAAVVKDEMAQAEIPAVMPSEVLNRDIETIVSLAARQGIRVVFFFMPVWSDRFQALGGEDYFKPISSYLTDLMKKYGNFFYYRNPSLLYPQEYYFDQVHLNRAGDEAFNAEFAESFPELLQKVQK